jgi:cytochrome P450
VLAWLIRATLDAMGLAGFGYSFDALTNPDPDADELAAAFATIFSSARKLRLITVFQAWFPVLRRFRPDRRVMDRARATMDRIGSALIAERTEHVLAQKTATSPSSTSSPGTTTVGRDLLSVMVKSSLSEEPSRRLSSSEALCQISTFLLAGHETTSNALSWSLYALARNSTSQAKLRAELRSVPIADPLCPSPDEVDAIAKLEYLDAVLRECLRLHAPVTSTMRVCARDADEVPVSEPFMDRHGQLRTAIPLKRGDIVSVPLQAVNCSRKIWGPDADEFRPERWAGPPVEAQAVPGVWANILTFLNGNALNGNRGCIGWRFALLEWAPRSLARLLAR